MVGAKPLSRLWVAMAMALDGSIKFRAIVNQMMKRTSPQLNEA